MKTVLVAMSGGVDSSVAAALLVERGHRVIGATMKTFCYSETAGPTRTCCGLDGIQDARRVCDALGIPHYVFDMEEAFTRDVIDDFVAEYAAGRTPNPCVRCNSNTKIPDLLRRGRALGADAIATGHFARRVEIARGGGDDDAAGDGGAPGDDAAGVLLRRGADPAKDQTYFLWGVPRAVLPSLLFPVGELRKAEVRQRARALGLATAEKPESQEICFVPDDDYAGFLRGRLGGDHAALAPGRIVDRAGNTLGEHGGYARFTVGQRRGLGGGRGRPLYVLGVRPAQREVVVGSAAELERDDVALGGLNWHAAPPAPGERVSVQLRHRAAAAPAIVTEARADRLGLRLEEPRSAVTPGQSGVVYRGDVLLGGGRIL
jgi:tRNA-uridine 2-sulfurtransferase